MFNLNIIFFILIFYIILLVTVILILSVSIHTFKQEQESNMYYFMLFSHE